MLERGREFRPGDFTNTLRGVLTETQITGRRLRFGPRTGLFDFRCGADINVLLGCGLGGGSLINAAVALRPERQVFAGPAWPKQLDDDDLLWRSFARAERMLGVRVCPGAGEAAKFKRLAEGAAALGTSAREAPLAISFEDGPNHAGIGQKACRLCGDCWSGCNVGAKNTVALTYLADARAHGEARRPELGPRLHDSSASIASGGRHAQEFASLGRGRCAAL